MSVESVRKTTCPGVAEYIDRSSIPPKYSIGFLKDLEPVEVNLSRDENGVIDVKCPFYGKGRVCNRGREIPFSQDQDINPGSPVCRYALAAEHQSYEVYTPAFKEHDFYKMVWKGLSSEAKTACVYMSPHVIGGFNNSAFQGMCHVFGICDSIEANKLIDELVENGAVEEMSRMDALREGVKQIKKDRVEDIELKTDLAGRKRAEQRLTYEISRLEDRIKGNRELIEKYKDDPKKHEKWRTSLQGWLEEAEEPHLRFSPGFQSFVEQFYNEYGFPINFTKPRLIDTL